MKSWSAVKDSVKARISSTIFEPWARSIWDFINPPDPKAVYIKQAPAYMTQILGRILTKDSNCIDVGCHSGGILSQILRLAPQGHHYAFEPIPRLAETLKQQFPGVDVRSIALSSSEGESEFNYVHSSPAYSGLKQRPYPTDNEEIEVIKVKTDRLDNVLSSGFKVDFIKVDVEGAELEVFKGAIATITAHKPYILFEHGPLSSKSYGSTPDQIYQLLVDQCGLKIFTLKGWLEMSNPLKQDEFATIQKSGLMWDYLAAP